MCALNLIYFEKNHKKINELSLKFQHEQIVSVKKYLKKFKWVIQQQSKLQLCNSGTLNTTQNVNFDPTKKKSKLLTYRMTRYHRDHTKGNTWSIQIRKSHLQLLEQQKRSLQLSMVLWMVNYGQFQPTNWTTFCIANFIWFPCVCVAPTQFQYGEGKEKNVKHNLLIT